MSHNLKTIVPLKPGTTAVMVSKYNNLVRTGVSQVRSSFIHAILTSYSKKYRDMNDLAKENYVNVLRAKIGSEMTISRWLLEIDQANTITLIQNRIQKIFIKIYHYLNNKIHDSKIDMATMNIITNVIDPYKDYFQSIISIMPIKTLDKQHLDHIFTNILDISSLTASENPPIEQYKAKIVNYLNTKFTEQLEKLPHIGELNKTIYKNFQQYFNKLVNSVINSAEKSTFENFKNNLISPDQEIGPYMFNFFSDYFKRNILFISSHNRKPINIAPKYKSKYSKTLILLHIDLTTTTTSFQLNSQNTLYESIGQIDNKHRISREYKNTNEIIQLIADDLKDGPSAAEMLDANISNMHPYTVDAGVDAGVDGGVDGYVASADAVVAVDAVDAVVAVDAVDAVDAVGGVGGGAVDAVGGGAVDAVGGGAVDAAGAVDAVGGGGGGVGADEKLSVALYATDNKSPRSVHKRSRMLNRREDESSTKDPIEETAYQSADSDYSESDGSGCD